MHISKKPAERHIMLKIENVAKRLNLGRMVIKHQQRASERQHHKQIERDTPHSPGIVVSHRVAVDLSWMEVQKDVGEHSQSTAARLLVMFDTENGLVELRLFRILQSLHVFEALFL